jgi:DNA-binding MarR family transcriptional regulator
VITRLYDDHLQELRISVAQLDILVTLLLARVPIRPIDLSREMLMDRSTVTRNLARLARLGLLELRPGNNGREHLIVVTPKGRRLVRRAETLWAQAQDAARSLLKPDGAAALELVSDRLGKES